MSRLLLSSRQTALTTINHLKKNVISVTPRKQKGLMSSGIFASRKKDDFRQIGTEKFAGALQDLLRRVTEIDADITNTPVVDFKPNTQHCVAYCITDVFDIPSISSKLTSSTDFHIKSSVSNMLHILDQSHGGDIYLFDNGTFVCWGLTQLQQEKFLKDYLRTNTTTKYNIIESTESAEYIIDEDELTDIKGDVILLNPHIPSIDLSKVAFSYGLGRAAKLTSIENSLDNYLSQFDVTEEVLSSTQQQKQQLLHIRQRMIKGSHDGFLGTPDFHWTRPELQDYVNNISRRFDVYTRIQILNKKLVYAIDVTKAFSFSDKA